MDKAAKTPEEPPFKVWSFWLFVSAGQLCIDGRVLERVDVRLIDEFLAGGEWTDAAWRAQLQSERQRAYRAWLDGHPELALALITGVWRECCRLGVVEAVGPKVRRDLKQQGHLKDIAAKGGASRAKLPMAPQELQAELDAMISNGTAPTAAKARLSRKYKCSLQALGQKLKKAKEP